jgi:hypothetical protein
MRWFVGASHLQRPAAALRRHPALSPPLPPHQPPRAARGSGCSTLPSICTPASHGTLPWPQMAPGWTSAWATATRCPTCPSTSLSPSGPTPRGPGAATWHQTTRPCSPTSRARSSASFATCRAALRCSQVGGPCCRCCRDVAGWAQGGWLGAGELCWAAAGAGQDVQQAVFAAHAAAGVQALVKMAASPPLPPSPPPPGRLSKRQPPPSPPPQPPSPSPPSPQ